MSDTDIARLGIEVDSTQLQQGNEDLDEFNRRGTKAEKTSKRFGDSQERAARQSRKLDRQLSEVNQTMRTLNRVFAVLGGFLAIDKLIQYSDGWRNVEGQLKTVTSTTEELISVQEDLFNVGQDVSLSYEAVAKVFTRTARATRQLGTSNKEVITITQALGNAVKVSGASATEANAALIQLSQGLAAGALRGDEFRSVSEQLPVVLDILTAKLNVTRGELRELAFDGKLTAGIISEALLEAAPELARAAENIPDTFERVLTRLQNRLKKFFGGGESIINVEGLTKVLAILEANFDKVARAIDAASAVLLVLSGQRIAAAIKGVVLLITRMNPLVSLFLAAVAAIGAFRDQISIAISGFSDLSITIEATNMALQTFLTEGAGAQSFSVLQAEVDQFKLKLLEAKDSILDLGKPLIDLAKSLFTFFSSVGQAVIELFDKVVGFVKQKIKEVLDFFKAQYERLPEFVKTGLEQTAQAAADAAQAAADVAQFAGEKIGEGLDAAGKAIQNTELYKGLRERFGEQLDDVIQDAQSVANELQEAGVDAGEAFVEGFDVVSAALDVGSVIFENREEIASDIRKIAIELDKAKKSNDQLNQSLSDSAIFGGGAKGASVDPLDEVRDKLKAITEQLLELIAAADIGPEEFRLTELLIQLRSRFKELSDEELRAEAEKIILLEEELDKRVRILEIQERIANTAENFALLPLENLIDGVEDIYNDFWDNFAEKGFNTFADLLDDVKGLFRQFAADILKKQFSGILQGIQQQIFNSTGNGKGIFKGLFGGSGGPTNLLPGGGRQGGSILSVGSVLGGAGLGFAGFGIGSSLGTLVGPKANPKNQAVGGAIGGGLGFAFGGPVGAFIGSTLGSFVGSLFGKRSSETAGANINLQTGAIENSFAKKNNPENIQDRDTILKTTFDALEQIKILTGASFGDNAALTASVSLDGIRVQTNAFGGDFAREDIEGATEFAIQSLIQSLRTGLDEDKILTPLAKNLASLKLPAEEIVGTLQQVKAVLNANEEQLGVFAQRAKDAKDAIQPVIDRLSDLGQGTEELEKILDKTLNKITDDFNNLLSDRLSELTTPTTFAVDQFVESLEDLRKEALAVNGDLDLLNQVFAAEFNSFINQIISSTPNIEDAVEALEKLKKAAGDFNVDTDNLDNEFSQSIASSVNDFINNLNQGALEFINQPLARFNELLNQQRVRSNQAQVLAQFATNEQAANLIAGSNRFNALQIQDFFESLSDEDKLQLGDFLGLIEDVSGRIAVVLAQLQSNFDKFITNLDETRQETIDSANALLQAANTIGQVRQQLQDQFNPQSPALRIPELRNQLDTTLERALNLDQSAIEDLPRIAQLLIEESRKTFASGDQFQDDLSNVLNALQQAEDVANNEAQSLLSEADRMIEELETLQDIRDILSQSDPSLDFLRAQLDENRLSNNLLRSLLTEYIRLEEIALQNQGITLDNLQSSALSSLQPTSNTSIIQPNVIINTDNDGLLSGISVLQETNNVGFGAVKKSIDDLAEEIRRDREQRQLDTSSSSSN